VKWGGCGTCGIWWLGKKFWTKWYEWAGALSCCSCQSAYTTQVTFATLHHAANGELRCNVVNSLIIWCILKINDAFVIEENCQHLSLLAPNLAWLFGLGEHVVFHCIDWVFVSGTNFTDMHFMPFFCQNGLYEAKQKPQLVGELLIATLWLSSTTECTLSIISWYLPVEGLSECSSLSTNACPSLNSLNHSLTCIWPIASFPKAFWIISYRLLSMSAHVSGKTWCRCAA